MIFELKPAIYILFESIKLPERSRKGPQICFQDEFKDESSVHVLNYHW